MTTYHHTSAQSSRLPGDEYRQLKREQDLQRLTTHFSHHGHPSPSHPRPNPSRDAGLSPESRYRSSEVRTATRAALGASFAFDDDTYGRLERHQDEHERSRGWKDDGQAGERIPAAYLAAFNQRWHEDDEDNDADQYMADHMKEAEWRKPAQLDAYHAFRTMGHGEAPASARGQKSPVWGDDASSTRSSARSTVFTDSGVSLEMYATQSTLRSQFSFDESDGEGGLEKRRKRSFFSRR